MLWVVKRKLVTRCQYKNCNEKITPINILIGKCKYCEYIYCSLHRLPESHLCINKDVSNQNNFDNNKK